MNLIIMNLVARLPAKVDKEKQAVLGVKAARDAALGEAANARGRCEVLEGELKGL